MTIHETTFRVLYAHTDKAGVVYHANYLMFFEAGRTEYIRHALGRGYSELEKEGVILTITEASLRYLAPAVYDDLLTIRTRVTRLRRTRIDFAYQVLGPTGKLLCEGATTLACLDAKTLRPMELPEEVKGKLVPEEN